MNNRSMLIPEFEQGINYKGLMARLIAVNEHDLVVEGANVEGEAVVYENLRSDYGWRGKYVTVNETGMTQIQRKDGSFECLITLKELHNFLVSDCTPFPIHTMGDCIDDVHLNAILDITKPTNPVYTVNSAIGIVLSYRRKEWGLPEWPRGSDEQNVAARRMVELWAGNLSNTKFRKAYFTSVVFPGESYFEAGEMRKTGYYGISEDVYEMFCGQFRGRGWGIEERDVLMSPSKDFVRPPTKLLVVHR